MTESQTPPPAEQNPSSEPFTRRARRDAAEPASTTGAPEQEGAPTDPETAGAAESGRADAAAQPGRATGEPDPDALSVAPVPPEPPHDVNPNSGRAPGEPLHDAPSDPDFPPASEPIAAPDTLDDGSFTQLREPRSGGLALDGTWHQISPKYVVSQFLQEAFFLVVVIAAATVVSITTGQAWSWIGAGIILLFQVVSLIILPRQARALGYMLRGDDIVFRKGILWQRMVAVPYGRMQLIDITHGPLDRIFRISKLKMVTAAASTGVEIPGLTDTAAEALRDTLIEVAETRRTGL